MQLLHEHVSTLWHALSGGKQQFEPEFGSILWNAVAALVQLRGFSSSLLLRHAVGLHLCTLALMTVKKGENMPKEVRKASAVLWNSMKGAVGAPSVDKENSKPAAVTSVTSSSLPFAKGDLIHLLLQATMALDECKAGTLRDGLQKVATASSFSLACALRMSRPDCKTVWQLMQHTSLSGLKALMVEAKGAASGDNSVRHKQCIQLFTFFLGKPADGIEEKVVLALWPGCTAVVYAGETQIFLGDASGRIVYSGSSSGLVNPRGTDSQRRVFGELISPLELGGDGYPTITALEASHVTFKRFRLTHCFMPDAWVKVPAATASARPDATTWRPWDGFLYGDMPQGFADHVDSAALHLLRRHHCRNGSSTAAAGAGAEPRNTTLPADRHTGDYLHDSSLFGAIENGGLRDKADDDDGFASPSRGTPAPRRARSGGGSAPHLSSIAKDHEASSDDEAAAMARTASDHEASSDDEAAMQEAAMARSRRSMARIFAPKARQSGIQVSAELFSSLAKSLLLSRDGLVSHTHSSDSSILVCLPKSYPALSSGTSFWACDKDNHLVPVIPLRSPSEPCSFFECFGDAKVATWTGPLPPMPAGNGESFDPMCASTVALTVLEPAASHPQLAPMAGYTDTLKRHSVTPPPDTNTEWAWITINWQIELESVLSSEPPTTLRAMADSTAWHASAAERQEKIDSIKSRRQLSGSKRSRKHLTGSNAPPATASTRRKGDNEGEGLALSDLT